MMEPIRFAIAGTGYRAIRYLRAALLLPKWFRVTGIFSRQEGRAESIGLEYGVKGCATLEALLETKPEFVLCCVDQSSAMEMNSRLLEAGMPTLSETPVANNVEDLLALYQVQKRTGTCFQLAEQYFLFPTHQARRKLMDEGILGDVTSCSVFSMHNYHAISLMRFYMGEDDGPVTIRGLKTVCPVVKAGDRSGFLTAGEMGQEKRMIAAFTYADGRVGLYDFADSQYRSAIRSMHMRVWGTRGEWFDNEARYLLADNRPVLDELRVQCDRITGTIRAVDFAGERVYVNPFGADVPMIEDDIAMCDILRHMGEAVRENKLFYPIRHVFRDGYLSCLLNKAVEAGMTMVSHPMPWDGEK